MRISSIDFFRTIAIFAIIVLHTSPFKGSDNVFFESLYIGLNQAARFAVPYFFIVAGYFFGRKILSGTLPEKAFTLYAKRLLRLFFIWTIVYMILPTDIKKRIMELGLWEATYEKIYYLVSDPLTLLFQGSRGHLWFFLSLVMALGIITIFLKLNKKQFIMPVSVSLYFFGLIAGSYSATPLGIDISFNTRNGPFFSTLLVAFGWYLASENFKMKPVYSLGLLTLGIFMHALEAYILWKYYGISPLRHDYLFGTLLCGVGLTMFVLSQPTLFEGNLLTGWGRYTLGIYVLHLLIIDMLTPLNKVIMFPLWDIIYPFIVYILCLSLVLVLSKNNAAKYIVAY